jgi:hypothetical protein
LFLLFGLCAACVTVSGVRNLTDWRDSPIPRANDSMSVPTTMGSPSSGPSLSHSELPKSLTILFEIVGRVVEDFVLL